MSSWVLGFGELDRSMTAVVGGKAANLGELSRIDGIRVPPGCCVTTSAFRLVAALAPEIDALLDRLSRVDGEDHEIIQALGAEIRRSIRTVSIPHDLAAEIAGEVARFGERAGLAVRSSATAEDLPTASFAGQHDTYLNVVGLDAVLEHVSRCWASLFTDRAVRYRIRNGIDHRQVDMAVVIQQMAAADASGIVFTADPVTSNRRVVVIEASFGLGEALVAGMVNADVHTVRDGAIVTTEVGTKQVAVHAAPAGGTREHEVDTARRDERALTDAQVLRLAGLGRRIEAHFGCPQDIEWCLVDGSFQFVQSRPITTLFPIPVVDDDEHHVYVSVGHQQMMTDPMKPLGLSLWQLTALPRMHEAGGRLFVEVTERLASSASRAAILDVMGRSDPLIRDALETILERGDFVPLRADDHATVTPPGVAAGGVAPAPIETDPALVADLIARNQASVAVLETAIAAASGAAVFDVVLADIQALKRLLFEPQNMQVIMAGMEATWWLNDQLESWLGEKNAADSLAQSAPGNVTSEMGLALLDVADVIRSHPAVVTFLRDVEQRADDGFLDAMGAIEGGAPGRDAIVAFLDAYGMRCAGEIDITRPRWSERPTTLVPAILDNVRNFEPGAAAQRFERGRDEASRTEEELLARVRALPDGTRTAAETKRMIDRLRAFVGYREYPKYGIVRRYAIYKRALLAEAEHLVREGVVGRVDDIFFLTFQELHDVVRTNRVDEQLLRDRRAAFRSYQSLTPPRVLTSDGEAVAGAYHRDDAPPGALVGLAVSAGTVEGRARVVLDMARADLEPGDILVTTFTDPSWTPLFVSIAGLVTEVGGLMTHGAVIAREYGLPAVVGVEHAVRRIRDGQRIRVHGTDGYVEILPEIEDTADLGGT